MNTNDVGRFISELRKEKGFTQKELAEKLSITDKAVSKWETGRSAPDISLLVPLSELLGVSVIEILNGEKIEKESFTEISDEVIVETMKSDKRKRKLSVIISVAATVLLFMLALLSYPLYHFMTSITIDDESAIIEEAIQIINYRYPENDEMKIVKEHTEDNYYFYLVQGEKFQGMFYYERNKIFENRMSFRGGGYGKKDPNKIEVHSVSGPGPFTLYVFYGFGMTDKEYSYSYRGEKITVPIKEELVLDVGLNIQDIFDFPQIVYDE